MVEIRPATDGSRVGKSLWVKRIVLTTERMTLAAFVPISTTTKVVSNLSAMKRTAFAVLEPWSVLT
jgi:hypothetical protein